jgi:hypothetical protein
VDDFQTVERLGVPLDSLALRAAESILKVYQPTVHHTVLEQRVVWGCSRGRAIGETQPKGCPKAHAF